MKKMMIFLLAAFIGVTSAAWASDVYVRGYYKDTNGDGFKDTYVQPYHRTSPDNSQMNNYGYPGNFNPNRQEITPQPRQQHNDPFGTSRGGKKNPYGW